MTETIVFDGNSLTAQGYPAFVVADLGPGFAQLNFGVSGQTTLDMSADAATQIDPLFVSGSTRLLVAWEITNDLVINGLSTTALDHFITYCAARKAAGWTVIVLSVLPRQVGPSFDAVQSAINTTMRSDFPTLGTHGARVYLAAGGTTWGDVLVDVAAIPEMADVTNPLYYVDGIHPTTLGYHLIATDVENGVTQALALPPLTTGRQAVMLVA